MYYFNIRNVCTKSLNADVPATTAAEAPPSWGSAQEKIQKVLRTETDVPSLPVELHAIPTLLLHGCPSTQPFVYISNPKWK